jgi:cytochrome b6
MEAIVAWLQERFDLEAVRKFAQKKSVPLHRYTMWYYVGGMTLFFFLVQVTTGILLMLYYRPSADEAFESVQFLMTTVPFGWLIRSIHSWSANLMVAAAFVHLFSVFFLRAYRRPRELTWVTGVLMLFLVMGFGFSGYLLPWNRLAFFATRVGTDVAGSVPIIGHWVLRFLRGGDYVTGGTLSRFYGWHVAILPAIMTILLSLHLLLVQLQGMSLPPVIEQRKGPRLYMPFFPNFMLRDLVGWLVALAVLATLAAIFPWELGEKADPFAPAYANIKPEWYFMFMFQTLKMVPGGEILGIETESWVIMAFGLAGLVLLLVPFLDKARSMKDPWIRHALGWFALAYMVVMTAIGYHALWLIPVAAGLIAMVFVQHSIARRKLEPLRVPVAVLGIFLLRGLLGCLLVASLTVPALAQDDGRHKPPPSSCVACHQAMGEEDPDLAKPLQNWDQDIHKQLGLGCESCHGGNPDPGFSENAERAMDPAAGYVGAPDRFKVAEFCGRCHSDVEYMRQYNPKARVDQVSEYRKSAHGIANANGDPNPATCIDCHGVHGILPVSSTNSPVHAENVPDTCNKCHGDAQLMSRYNLPTDMYEKYKNSVHAYALYEKGDTGAPVCNDCHGNHGAAPPGAESVANVCGQCHVREATLFRGSWKKEVFDEMGESECDICHGHHEIKPATIEMLAGPDAVCLECHDPQDQSSQVTAKIYGSLKKVQDTMKEAQETLEAAERAGVEVSQAIFHLKKEGVSTLVNARALIHAFDAERLLKEADKALKVAEESRQAGIEALKEVRRRRAGLVGLLVLTVLVIITLSVWIRRVDARHPVIVEKPGEAPGH